MYQTSKVVRPECEYTQVRLMPSFTVLAFRLNYWKWPLLVLVFEKEVKWQYQYLLDTSR